jgi:mannan endo-1,6-alpha-mannosidase
MNEVQFIDADFNVYDGAGVEQGCTQISRPQWTYNAGIFLHGAAVMYNVTDGSDLWQQRVQGLMTRTIEVFFVDGIPIEHPCEPSQQCDTDQLSFKGYLMRWMAASSQVAPFAFDTLMPLVKSSAAAAAQQCSGSPPASDFKGDPGTACGFKWTEKANFDGNVGVGQQMSALSALQYTLIKKAEVAKAPITASTGGTSLGNVNAGASTESKIPTLPPITTGERVAAGFATTAILLSVLGGSFFVMKD